MRDYIIQKDGVYNIYSTSSHGCWFNHGITLNQLQDVLQKALGEISLRVELAQKTGCSEVCWTLENCIELNRAGSDDSYISPDQFIAQFLTLPEPKT